MEKKRKQRTGKFWKAVLSLPAKYKDVVYLHYYEGYTAGEISNSIGGKCKYSLYISEPRQKDSGGKTGR